ncbi:hypothetical protein C8Q74DRAFT_1273543 [Fomes fomentarius]|nr:hypothetical protein C8Q74DRAFT_1273543 [Fomes fomentarius]
MSHEQFRQLLSVLLLCGAQFQALNQLNSEVGRSEILRMNAARLEWVDMHRHPCGMVFPETRLVDRHSHNK